MPVQFDKTTDMLQQSLDLRLQRQNVLSSNLANIDTPGFRPADLKFEGFLQDAEAATDVGAAEATEVVRDESSPTTLDGNTVHLDEEVAKMTENALRYNTALELMRRKMALISYAAQGS